jgi:hypothetical protein
MKKAIVCVLVALTVVVGGCGKGVVSLEGYKHGVVICGNSLVVNAGHYNDPEVDQLIALAEKECK